MRLLWDGESKVVLMDSDADLDARREALGVESADSSSFSARACIG